MYPAQIVFPDPLARRARPSRRRASVWLLALATCALAGTAISARAQCFTNAEWSVRADFSGTTTPSQPASFMPVGWLFSAINKRSEQNFDDDE